MKNIYWELWVTFFIQDLSNPWKAISRHGNERDAEKTDGRTEGRTKLPSTFRDIYLYFHRSGFSVRPLGNAIPSRPRFSAQEVASVTRAERKTSAAVRGPVWIVKHVNYPGACLNEADVRRMSYDRYKGSDTSRQVQSHNAAPTNITALSSLLNRYFRLAVTAPWLLSSLPLCDGTQRAHKVDHKRTDDDSRRPRPHSFDDSGR